MAHGLPARRQARLCPAATQRTHSGCTLSHFYFIHPPARMPTRPRRSTTPPRPCHWLSVLRFVLAAFPGAPARAQAPAGWQACAAETGDGARLACYDRWARGAAPTAPPAEAQPQPAPSAGQQVTEARKDPAPVLEPGGCHDTSRSELSRFWELERATGCGVF